MSADLGPVIGEYNPPTGVVVLESRLKKAANILLTGMVLFASCSLATLAGVLAWVFWMTNCFSCLFR